MDNNGSPPPYYPPYQNAYPPYPHHPASQYPPPPSDQYPPSQYPPPPDQYPPAPAPAPYPYPYSSYPPYQQAPYPYPSSAPPPSSAYPPSAPPPSSAYPPSAPPPSSAYPPSPSHSSTTYPPSPTSYPQSPSSASSHSGPFDYNQPPYPYPYPPARPSTNSGPLPTLQHQGSGSFKYDSNHYQYQQSGMYPPVESPHQSPLRASRFSLHQRYDSCPVGVEASGYPPVDQLLSNMHLSENQPTDNSVGPSAPSSARCDKVGEFYGYPNSSFTTWETSSTYSGNQTESPSPVLTPTTSINGSQHSQSLQIVPLQNKGSLKVLLLHGNLDIWVYEAKNLPNMDMFHKTLGDMFMKFPGTGSNKADGQSNRGITSDPYVSISVANAVIGRTYVISNSEFPVWRQHFNVPVAHYAAEVHFVVKDSDLVGSQLIGIVAIPVEHIYLGARVEGIYPILNASGKPCKPGAVLRLSIQYTPIERLSIYHNGVGAGPDYYGVPGTYFPLRTGGKVTLYQDAHVPDGCLPNLILGGGRPYVHGKCWHDIFDAIRQAQRLIYIAGWSVWHNVKLVRDGGAASSVTIGDLLRSKSQEGVRVLLLVWDDPTSRSILGYKTDGIMQTHDEEIRRFFKHSSVQVLLCPRTAGKRHSWVKQREVGTIYTHHQKTVIVDADAGHNRRKILAFVGGLDLCDGRYDTPNHELFKTLKTVHKDDYHNPTFTGSTAGCPREPWHDLHSRLDGPAAYDVLTNFEERWLKASKPQGMKKLKKSYNDSLLKLERIPDIIGAAHAASTSDNDPETWHVQIFRSIDSNSVKGFPKDPKEATSKNLVCGKNVLIDMSIHTAYVKAIRAAQHFIYVENQYFIGSSYNWNQYKDLGANNLIPMEIALKIAEKIRAHERFAAYIVIPMWPEGVPTGAATQRILFWQHKTMQMMYETIYKALVEMGLEGAFCPQDYLNFFCLGNREAIDGNDTSVSGSPAAANTPQAFSQKSRRFMIYVHSKGMIVDDEYVIVGSANINQRSMEGTRDTEIAMGAYQPHHTWARNHSSPFGEIYGYRMSLWAEHTGTIEDCFREPESLECVRRVRAMGEMNWKQFAAEHATEMTGHLLKYPVEIDRKGKVTSLPGCESFPDVGGNITGSFLGIQENLTI
ncbi:putative phospholipase D [Rosa chinensis]|uniref:Phospholipase D alpha 1 n=1 Tax=Rosa chinensis TaxID=74649 RepID=A0A2P6SGE3_ROSCH|nr:phospholipase D gamma 1 isoform X1 [Rosa chinensis]PRQ57754.1 putative phospholipase D [Rosa chinensis]